MNPHSHPRAGLASLAVLLLLPLAAPAASPREDLLRLVPEDAGFCFVMQDVRGHFDRLANSPFVAAFQKSPLGTVIRNAQEMQKLLEMEKTFSKFLGVEWTKLRDEVFGDAVVFAYRPGKKEQDLLLLKARDPKVLAELIDKVNEMQKASGELKELEAREHGNTKYFRRVEKKQEGYYFLRDGLLVLSSREDGITQTIDRIRKGGDGESPVAKQFRLLGADGAFLALWINPRAFDADMEARLAEAKAAKEKAGEAAVIQTMLVYWKLLDGVALTANLEKDFELALCVRAQTDKLPEAVKRFLAECGKPSELWQRFPEDALLAVAGRVDLPAALDLLGEFLTKEDRQSLLSSLQKNIGAALGKDVVGEILPNVGPDWGLCVTAPPADSREWFPHVILAIKASPGAKGEGIDQTLLTAIHSYALVTVINYNRVNKDHITLKTVSQDKVEVRYLVNDEKFPPGLRPAYALANGYLVFASSPEALGGFVKAKPTPVNAGEFPLLRLSLQALRQYVKDRKAPLAVAVAEKNELTKEEAEKRLDALLAGLGLVDRLELTQRPAQGQVTWTLRLRTAQPLAK